MSKFNVFLLLTAVILLAMVFTNPKEQAHKDAVRDKMNALLHDGMAETKLSESSLAMGVGSLVGGVVMGQLADNLITCDNYVIFSLTKIGYAGTTKTIGVGVLGNVFISTKLDKDLREWQEKAGEAGKALTR